MATFNDSSNGEEKEEEEKYNEMAREQRGKYIYVCMYILFTWNNNNKIKKKRKQTKKKRNKQETDYNKILVGARKRDRKQTKDEMIINSRLNGSSWI